MDKLVVRTGGQNHDGLDRRQLVVEHDHSQPELLALPTPIGAFDLDEEW